MIIHYIDVGNQQASFDLYKGTYNKYLDGAVLSPGKTWTYQDNDVSVKVYVNSIYKGTTKYSNIVKFTVTSPIQTPSKPVAIFSAFPTSGKAPLNVQFTDQSTGSPTSWSWKFGDGTTSTVQNSTHKYTKAGKYSVSLTVKNTVGNSTTTKSNYISVTTVIKPVAAFTATPTSGKAPLSVKFTDKSTNNPTSWTWKFGDGGTSTIQKPTHKYTKKGTYAVSLTVKNAAGSNSITKSKYITVK
jgi:PKD repeat protein